MQEVRKRSHFREGAIGQIQRIRKQSWTFDMDGRVLSAQLSKVELHASEKLPDTVMQIAGDSSPLDILHAILIA